MSQASFVNKLNLYEFSAYLFPGAVFIFFLNIGLNLCGINLNTFKTNIMVDSIFAFVLFYFSGLLLHELSNIYENYELIKKIMKGFPSKKFLQKDSKIIYNDDDKIICWKLAKKHLFLNINLRHQNKEELKEKISYYSQIIYEKFREALIRDSVDPEAPNKAEMYNNHYGMYRTLIVMALLLILFFAFTSIYSSLTQSSNPTCSILLMVSFYAIAKILCIRLKRFANYHVKYVINQYISKNNNLNLPSFTTSR